MRRQYAFKKKWKRNLTFWFDAISSLLTVFFFRNFKISSSSLKKILVTRIDHLGDALLLRPALLRLRQGLPDAQIHLLTTPENAPIFLLDRNVDKVISFEGHWFQKKRSLSDQIKAFFRMRKIICRERFDLAIDFRGDLRANLLFFLSGIPVRIGYGITGGGWMLTHEKPYNPEKHQVPLNLELISDLVSPGTEIMNPRVIYPQSTPFQLTHQLHHFERPYAVIHPGAGNPLKEWPQKNFLRLIELLLDSKLITAVFLVGSVSEQKKSPFPNIDQVKDLRGLTDLHELSFLLENALFFFGNDSGPAHLAAAQGIPVAVVASKTNQIEFWHPWTEKLKVLTAANSEELVSPERAQAAIIELLAKHPS